MIKKIELEVWFPDDFVPPEKFEDRCSGACPFLSYEPDDCSDAFCCLVGTEGDCPIKEYFK